jgi:hypothetical protein
MIKQLSTFAVLCALCFGFSMSAQAVSVFSQTFYYNGTCTGLDQTTTLPFPTPVTATLGGGDIVIFQPPAAPGINYAFAGISASTNIILWAGPGQTHVTSFEGFSGDNIGFPVTTTTKIDFDLSCNAIGSPWQAFLTLWYSM